MYTVVAWFQYVKTIINFLGDRKVFNKKEDKSDAKRRLKDNLKDDTKNKEEKPVRLKLRPNAIKKPKEASLPKPSKALQSVVVRKESGSDNEIVHKHKRIRAHNMRRPQGFRLRRISSTVKDFEASKERIGGEVNTANSEDPKSPEASKLNLVRVKPPTDFLRLHKLNEFSEPPSPRPTRPLRTSRPVQPSSEDVIQPVVEQKFVRRVPRLDDFETRDSRSSATEDSWERSVLRLPGRLSTNIKKAMEDDSQRRPRLNKMAADRRSRTPRLDVMTEEAEAKQDFFSQPDFFGDFPDLPKFHESFDHHQSFDPVKLDFVPDTPPSLHYDHVVEPVVHVDPPAVYNSQPTPHHVPEAVKKDHTYTDKYVPPDKENSKLYVSDPWKDIDKIDVEVYTPKPYVPPPPQPSYPAADYEPAYEPEPPKVYFDEPVYKPEPYKTTVKPYKPKPTYVYKKPTYRPPVASKPHQKGYTKKLVSKPKPYKPPVHKPEPYKPLHHEPKPDPYHHTPEHHFDPHKHVVHKRKPEPYIPVHNYDSEPFLPVKPHKPDLPKHGSVPHDVYKPEHTLHHFDKPHEQPELHHTVPAFEPFKETYKPQPSPPATDLHHHNNQPHSQYPTAHHNYNPSSSHNSGFSFDEQRFLDDFSFDKHLDFSLDRSDDVSVDSFKTHFPPKHSSPVHRQSTNGDSFKNFGDGDFFGKPIEQVFERPATVVDPRPAGLKRSDRYQAVAVADKPSKSSNASPHPLDADNFGGFSDFGFPRDFGMSSSGSQTAVFASPAPQRAARRIDGARYARYSIYFLNKNRTYRSWG